MAHQLKYYKEIDSHGHLWRVEILQETEDTLTPMEIGPVLQGLRLVVQGDQADVDTPIVKTSLEMTFVDAPDLEEERKCGYWEEFYTSSATEYQVKLYKDGQIEWTGYVTPDSFSEDLRYRGSVSIIARDNLGALQDFYFDMDAMSNDLGMVSATDLLIHSFRAASIGMTYNIADRPIFCSVGENVQPGGLYSSEFNGVSFKGKTLWEALETVMYSLGICLRYIGGNKFIICTIRDLALNNATYWWDVARNDVRLIAAGHRELSPAVKSIKEEVKFEIAENLISAEIAEDKYGEAGQVEFAPYNTSLLPPPNYTIPVHAYDAANGWQATPASQSLLLNPFAYRTKSGHAGGQYGQLQDPEKIYIAVNDMNPDAIARYEQYLTAGKYEFKIHIADLVALYDDGTRLGIMDTDKRFIQYLTFRARYYSLDGRTHHYNGSSWVEGESDAWVSNSREDDNGYIYPYDLPYDFILPIDDFGLGRFELEIGGVRAAWTPQDNSRKSRGGYAMITEVSLADKTYPDGVILNNLKVMTNYSAANNIVLSRQPEYAPNASDFASPRAVLNGIFTLNAATAQYVGSSEWYWNTPEEGQPLAVLIHRQILAYYAKPNNVLTGELVLDGGVPDFRSLWRWGGKDHLLMSGTLNVLTGRMENAVLREFTRYDRMWETWVDNEDINIDYAGEKALLQVYTEVPELTDAYVFNLPSWLSLDITGPYGDKLNRYELKLYAMENASGQERQAIFRIDTAYVRVTQRAAGDYGIDYGKDYS